MIESLDLDAIRARCLSGGYDLRPHDANEDVEALIAEVERLRGVIHRFDSGAAS